MEEEEEEFSWAAAAAGSITGAGIERKCSQLFTCTVISKLQLYSFRFFVVLLPSGDSAALAMPCCQLFRDVACILPLRQMSTSTTPKMGVKASGGDSCTNISEYSIPVASCISEVDMPPTIA